MYRILIAVAIAAAILTSVAIADSEAQQKPPSITKESDNPWIWKGVAQVLKQAEITYSVKEIRQRPEVSILTLLVTLECEPVRPGLNVVQVHYDGTWKLAPKSRPMCEPAR